MAEIPGTDPKLKDQVVMVGGHLDSWIGGTGATDNGAGAIVAMEAMRILKALDVHPRRTIRIALWSGEEQGLFGSLRLCGRATCDAALLHRQGGCGYAGLCEADRLRHRRMKPEAAKFDAYYNMDNGTGKLLGVYVEGNAAIAPIFAQWMQPLADLGMTTISMRNTGSTDHCQLSAGGAAGVPVHPGPARLREPHAPHQPGHL